MTRPTDDEVRDAAERLGRAIVGNMQHVSEALADLAVLEAAARPIPAAEAPCPHCGFHDSQGEYSEPLNFGGLPASQPASAAQPVAVYADEIAYLRKVATYLTQVQSHPHVPKFIGPERLARLADRLELHAAAQGKAQPAEEQHDPKYFWNAGLPGAAL